MRILIVDDNRLFAEALSDVVCGLKLGDETRIACTSEAGLAALHDWRPEVVFMDGCLDPSNRSNREGVELGARALDLLPDVVLCLLTGYDLSSAMQGRFLGRATVFRKPMDDRELKLFLAYARSTLAARKDSPEEASARRALVDVWTERYRLTPKQALTLALAVAGADRGKIAQERGVVHSTLGREIKDILHKTGDHELRDLVIRFQQELIVLLTRRAS